MTSKRSQRRVLWLALAVGLPLLIESLAAQSVGKKVDTGPLVARILDVRVLAYETDRPVRELRVILNDKVVRSDQWNGNSTGLEIVVFLHGPPRPTDKPISPPPVTAGSPEPQPPVITSLPMMNPPSRVYIRSQVGQDARAFDFPFGSNNRANVSEQEAYGTRRLTLAGDWVEVFRFEYKMGSALRGFRIEVR